MPEYDPKTRVEIAKVEKKGEWYTVKGHVDGKSTEAHIPAPTLDARSDTEAVALMRRTLLGTKLAERDRRD